MLEKRFVLKDLVIYIIYIMHSTHGYSQQWHLFHRSTGHLSAPPKSKSSHGLSTLSGVDW